MMLKKYKLGEVAKFEISNIDKKTKEGEAIVSLCNFTDVYYNWAVTESMSDAFMIASASESQIEKLKIQKGQVSITKDSETRDDIGIPCYIADDFQNTVLGYHCALITPNPLMLDGRYLNAFLNSKLAKKYFSNNAVGSGMRYSLSVDAIKNISLYLPDIKIQKIIGELFSNIDRKIALNREINRNLEALARQLYDYWFVQFDFPDENGRPYKSSGGKMVWNEKLKREIPKGWNVLSVNDIASNIRGVSYAKDQLVDAKSGILVLRGNNIQDNHITYDSNVAYIPKELVSEEQLIQPLDIIMTMSSGSKEHIGKCAMFQKASKDTFGAFLTKFTAKKHYAYLLFNLFCSQYFREKIKSIACGTGINNLTNQTFDEIYVAIPQYDILVDFDKKASLIYSQIGVIENNNTNLTKQRDELLPLLMNGQATVNCDLSPD